MRVAFVGINRKGTVSQKPNAIQDRMTDRQRVERNKVLSHIASFISFNMNQFSESIFQSSLYLGIQDFIFVCYFACLVVQKVNRLNNVLQNENKTTFNIRI